jgi:hypothetical protein
LTISAGSLERCSTHGLARVSNHAEANNSLAFRPTTGQQINVPPALDLTNHVYTSVNSLTIHNK